MTKETDIIWLESILKATPEAVQHIADNKSVAQNLRDAFPNPYSFYWWFPQVAEHIYVAVGFEVDAFGL